MHDTRILIGLDLSLTNIKRVQIFMDRMDQQPEFKDAPTSQALIGTLQVTLKLCESALKQLYQRAAAHSLKKE